MAWYYEILGKNEEVLETSEPVYANQFEPQIAGYRRTKERPEYFYGPIPPTGGKVEGGLRHMLMSDTPIRAKQKDD